MRNKVQALVVLAVCACGAPLQIGGEDAGPDAGIDGGATDSGLLYEGYVELQTDSSGGTTFYGFQAEILPTQSGGWLCPGGQTQGPCCVSLYSGDGGTWTPVSAGTMTVTNPDAGQTLEWPWDPSTGTYGDIQGFVTWVPGTVLSVAAAGNVADAFTAQVAAPAPIAGLPQDGGALPISVAAPWQLHWTPAGATYMDVMLLGPLGYTVCRVADGDGSATVPATLIAAVAGDGGAGYASATRSNAVETVSANALVEVRISLGATSEVTFGP
jgi:hypothetical protein